MTAQLKDGMVSSRKQDPRSGKDEKAMLQIYTECFGKLNNLSSLFMTGLSGESRAHRARDGYLGPGVPWCIPD